MQVCKTKNPLIELYWKLAMAKETSVTVFSAPTLPGSNILKVWLNVESSDPIAGIKVWPNNAVTPFFIKEYDVVPERVKSNQEIFECADWIFPVLVDVQDDVNPPTENAPSLHRHGWFDRDGRPSKQQGNPPNPDPYQKIKPSKKKESSEYEFAKPNPYQ